MEKLSNGEDAPYVFLGDDAFALKKYMMKPFPQQGLTQERRIYNYRHSRGEYRRTFLALLQIDGESFLQPSIWSRNV